MAKNNLLLTILLVLAWATLVGSAVLLSEPDALQRSCWLLVPFLLIGVGLLNLIFTLKQICLLIWGMAITARVFSTRCEEVIYTDDETCREHTTNLYWASVVYELPCPKEAQKDTSKVNGDSSTEVSLPPVVYRKRIKITKSIYRNHGNAPTIGLVVFPHTPRSAETPIVVRQSLPAPVLMMVCFLYLGIYFLLGSTPGRVSVFAAVLYYLFPLIVVTPLLALFGSCIHYMQFCDDELTEWQGQECNAEGDV